MKKSALIVILCIAGLLSACLQDTPSRCIEDETIVRISPKSATLVPGDTVQGIYYVERCQPLSEPPTGQTEPPIDGLQEVSATWRSEDPNIATVNSSLLITGVAVGKTDIVIEDTYYGIVVRIPITVVAED